MQLSTLTAATEEMAQLQKALQAGYGTDSATLTGGGALRIQSLEHSLMSLLYNTTHFALYNKLPKETCTATVDEWTELSDIGGYLGGSVNAEMGIIKDATGSLTRRVGMVKHLMTRRQVSTIAAAQNNILEPESVEVQNGALQLLRDVEYLLFEGNSAVVGVEFDGIATQLKSLNSSDHIIDLQGAALNDINMISRAAEVIAYRGNGNATDIFMNYSVQKDLNDALNPAFRISLNDKPTEIANGAVITDINTSFGVIKTNQDRFVRDEREKVPFELLNPATAAANAFKPASVSIDATVTDGGTKFASNTGNYYYVVTGINAEGQSLGVVTAQTAVAAGKKVMLTIAKSVAGTETGYVIYRSRKNGTNALSDVREMVRIPVSGGATTVYNDLNEEIPGTTTAYVLDLGQNGTKPITWRSLIPMARVELAVTNQLAKTWAQFMSGYLRVGIRQRHVVIKNIVPTGANWKPFA